MSRRIRIGKLLNQGGIRRCPETKAGSILIGSTNHFNDLGGADERCEPAWCLIRVSLRKFVSRFLGDEVRHARRLLKIVDDVAHEYLDKPPRVIVIIGGYATSEVIRILRSAVILIIFNPVTFREELEYAVDEVIRDGSQRENDSKWQSELEALRMAVNRLEEKRAIEVERLEERLLSVVSRAPTPKEADPMEVQRHRWSEERRNLEDPIERARADRRAADFAELRRLATRTEADRRARLRTIFGVVAGVFLVGGTALQVWSLTKEPKSLGPSFGNQGILVGAIGAAVISIRHHPTRIVRGDAHTRRLHGRTFGDQPQILRSGSRARTLGLEVIASRRPFFAREYTPPRQSD